MHEVVYRTCAARKAQLLLLLHKRPLHRAKVLRLFSCVLLNANYRTYFGKYKPPTKPLFFKQKPAFSMVDFVRFPAWFLHLFTSKHYVKKSLGRNFNKSLLFSVRHRWRLPRMPNQFFNRIITRAQCQCNRRRYPELFAHRLVPFVINSQNVSSQ